MNIQTTLTVIKNKYNTQLFFAVLLSFQYDIYRPPQQLFFPDLVHLSTGRDDAGNTEVGSNYIDCNKQQLKYSVFLK